MSDNDDSAPDGVQLDLISSSRSKEMGPAEKLGMILDRVAEGAVVILEAGLTPDEEALLIERTMEKVDGESFTGIEIESYREQSSRGGFFGKLVGNNDSSRLTVIGPANKMKTLDKNETLLRTLVSGDV